MKPFITVASLLLLLLACAQANFEFAKQTSVAATVQVILSLTPLPSPGQSATPLASTPDRAVPLAVTSPVPETPVTPASPAPLESLIVPVETLDQSVSCGDVFMARISETPSFTRDLFEHHAKGTFLIITLELVNLTDQAVQIWDGDYFLEGQVNGKAELLTPRADATGYLYNVQHGNWYQDQIAPGKPWHTMLAFDVDPAGGDWYLVIKPGYELGEALCEARLRIAN